MMIKELELIEKLRDMNLELDMEAGHIWCNMLRITNEFLDEVRVEQGKDQDEGLAWASVPGLSEFMSISHVCVTLCV